MREARDDSGVVNACTYDGREELLNNFSTEIEMCEKALDQYLGQKKKMFARFYFVSDQALLEILSNSNNPEKVDEYIGDCFDGMKRLEFVRGAGIAYPSKRAKSMISKDTGEEVYFYKEFQAVGPVESYLTDLEKLMRDSLKHILG
jgi:dynein heavy chain